MEPENRGRPRSLQRTHGWTSFSIGVAMAIVIVWSWMASDIEFARLGNAGDRIVDFVSRMLPPDLSVLPVVVDAASETLRIAILGTLGSVILSIVLGPLAASTLTPRFVHIPLSGILAMIRAVPLILVAMLLVIAVGPGPLAGILAILFHGTGMLAKFYAEAIEGADHTPIEALESAGATSLQRLRFGIWPQIVPDIVRDTLFRLELNLRESLILGVVGAGGIGFYISIYVNSFQYQKVTTLTLVVVAFVLIIELGARFLRHRFR